MGGEPTRACTLPEEFPIFPLDGALLLPWGRLPLNIFEPRYLAMVEDALGAGRLFGMVQPDPTLPRCRTGPGLFQIGCLGRICSFSESDDGRYLITIAGIVRYRIGSELAMRRGYRRVRGDFTEFLEDLEKIAGPGTFDRDSMLAELRGYFTRSGFEANWDAIARISDDQLVTTLCMACPFESAEKQALLEAPSLAERAATLLALLQMGGLSGGGPARVAS
jgi:Lon protease-like protein